MKNIYQLFNHLEKEEIDSILDSYGLVIEDNFKFSDFNIVIGVNGSGKTRFLKAVKELSQKNNEKVIYGYFPKLADKRITVSRTDDNLPEATLYEAVLYDYDFEDFLEEIQNQNDSFIAEVLHYQSKVQRKKNKEIVSSFSESFKKLTGYELSINNKNILMEVRGEIIELKDALDEFSPGQLMLFYLSVFISLQNNKTQQIIVLDEPESHLHPSALLDFISLLKATKCYSNLFIATHSLFLIPEYDFENIIYIDKNTIHKRNSELYQRLLKRMIGENFDKKLLFFSSVNQWQYANYLAECFTNPSVIDEMNPRDEQVRLFVEFLNQKKSINILDFGGGSARLGRSVQETDFENKSNIKYDVFDINIPDDTHGFRYYCDFKDVPKKYYDCVIMMNTLHEIEPEEWVNIFKNLYKAMSDKSYLLFVETSVLTKGEMPNNTGYLVMGNSELQKLFCSKKSFPEIRIAEKQKSICLLIKKTSLNKITEQSVQSAITQLQNNAYANLLRERENNNRGRKYAFYTQLYINAKLFNERIVSKTISKEISTGNKKMHFTQEEKNRLLDDLSTCLDKIILAYQKEFDMKRDIKELCFMLKKNYIFFFSPLEDIWKRVIQLEELNANKRLIAVALLILTLADYKKAENRFKNNGYFRYLPSFIKLEYWGCHSLDE